MNDMNNNANTPLEWEEYNQWIFVAHTNRWEYRIDDKEDDQFTVSRYANITNNSDDPDLAIEPLTAEAATLQEAVQTAERWHAERYSDHDCLFKADLADFDKKTKSMYKHAQAKWDQARRLLDAFTPTRGIKGATQDAITRQAVTDAVSALLVVARERNKAAALDEIFQWLSMDRDEADIRRRVGIMFDTWDTVNESLRYEEKELKERKDQFNQRLQNSLQEGMRR